MDIKLVFNRVVNEDCWVTKASALARALVRDLVSNNSPALPEDFARIRKLIRDRIDVQ